jgi:hypothetical protein
MIRRSVGSGGCLFVCEMLQSSLARLKFTDTFFKTKTKKAEKPRRRVNKANGKY